MKVFKEVALRHFDFWSGAKDRASLLTCEELDAIEYEIESIYPEGIDETSLNDWFWFDFDSIAEMLGVTEDEIFERGRK